MKETLIVRLETLLNDGEFKQIRDEVAEIAQDYRKLLRNMRNTAFEAHKNEGKNPEEFVAPEKDELDAKFDALFVVYNEKKEQHQQQRMEAEARRAENQKKRAEEDKQRMAVQAEVIKELTALVENGEQSNEAFNQFKEIQNKWKAIGRVSLEEEEAKKLHADFNHQLDLFRHNRRIALDLLSLDYAKNLAVKEFLLAKMEKLAEIENVNEVAIQMRQYQAEWNKTGPVGRNERDAVNNKFKELADAIYSKIQGFYDERRGQLGQNAEAKQSLIDKANALCETELTLENAESLLQEALGLQEAWKKTGYTNKNEEYWQTFRTACDKFFEKRKSLLKEGDKIRETHKLQKIALCEKAEELQHNTEWVKTGDTLIKLQKEWQTIGAASRGDENKLWNRFREACDKFFAAKKEHFSSLDQNQEANLAAKEALIQQITDYQFDSENIEGGFDALKDFSDQWAGIGLVPIKEKNRLQTAYKKVLDARYAEIKKMREDSRLTRGVNSSFRKRMDNVRQATSNFDRVPNREEDRLRFQIEQLEEEIAQYENNLGFFANSKSNNKNPLLKDVEEKIKKLKSDIQALRTRLKVLATPVVAAPEVTETAAEATEAVAEEATETVAEATEVAAEEVAETAAEATEVAAEEVAETAAEATEVSQDNSTDEQA